MKTKTVAFFVFHTCFTLGLYILKIGLEEIASTFYKGLTYKIYSSQKQHDIIKAN